MLLLATILCGQTLAQAQFPLSSEGALDETELGYATLEIRCERSSYYVQEPIAIVVHFGFEKQIFEEKLVPLFRPPMDISVQVQAPWLANLSGATPLEPTETEPAQADGSKTFVLNDALARARPVPDLRVDGREFRSYEFERTFLATAPGSLELPESQLRFAYGTRWNEGYVTDHVLVDRVEAFVRGAGRSLTILPLPETGRPEGFSGAVGRLSLRGETSARDVELGSSLKLVLQISGEGNLEFFDAPRLERIEGWRVNGSTDQKSRALRTIEYDISPESAQVTRLPQVAFSFFDTTPPASYRTLRTDAIPIAVRAAASQANGKQQTGEPTRENAPAWPIGVAIGFAALAAAIGGALWLRGRRSTSPG
ncbi:MAG TPA: hypothetical protein VK843_08250 [Planctomycetota bacterium]|nr:hypothetical protein [Planctomycetota bacterium]